MVQRALTMKTTLAFLLLTFTLGVATGQDPDAVEPDAHSAREEIVAYDTAMVAEQKELEEVILDMKADEVDVVAAVDEPAAATEEVQVVHDEAVLEVQMEDVEEMMLDIKDDEMDNDADIIERKLDDIKDAKEHNAKTAAQHRKHELEKKKKRNSARKAKHEARAKKHAERHRKVDTWIAEMRKNHPNKAKREAMLNLYNMLNSQHAAMHAKLNA